MISQDNNQGQALFSWARDQAAVPPARSISEWVESEIYVPDSSPKPGIYKHSNHPVSRIWFNELENEFWRRFAITAPTQNGKTLMGYVIPVCYHLFELRETVVVGIPDMRMANDKWKEDFKPIVERNWPALIPITGEGSRGGVIKSRITFNNGSTLRFMSGGGSVKGQAGFRTRVVAITETDGMDEPGPDSREADACRRIEARNRASGDSARAYLECTVSVEEGRIWQEYVNGSHSRLIRPCPHCNAWVTPEREHLKGWQEAETEEQARQESAWYCPECDTAWTQEDREKGWSGMKLIHDGQEVTPEGEIVGPPPKSRTLGFRWAAIDNPFTNAGICGVEEWHAKRSKDKENAEKEICQWTCATPYQPPNAVIDELEPEQVAASALEAYKRGIVPEGCIGIAIGIDTHKRDLYWEAKAVLLRAPSVEWSDEEFAQQHPEMVKPVVNLHVIDHGVLKLEPNQLVKEAIIKGLVQLHKSFMQGWMDEQGNKWLPSQVWVDSGYAAHKMAIYQFCAAANKGLNSKGYIWRPAKGHGEGQLRSTVYRAPEAIQTMQSGRSVNPIAYIGRDYHIVRIMQGNVEWKGVQLVHVNSDTWKTAFHQGILVDQGESGSVTLFAGDGADRDMYEAQVCGEIQKEKFIKGKGSVPVWVYVSANHYLDAGYLATAAADYVVENKKWLTGKPVARKRAESYGDRPTAKDVSPYAGRPTPGMVRA